MWLSDISIKRPVLATVMSLMLLLFGVVGLSRLSVREYPDIDPPVVSVSTVYPGASPEVVESTVTERLEDELISVEGIKTLTSSSQEGGSVITIEFELVRPIDLAAQDVRDRVSRARGLLPEEIEEPIIAKQDADASPIIWLGLGGKGFTQLQITDYADRYIVDQLQTIPGVGRIIIGGAREYSMRLWLDAEKMAARDVTVLDVRDALQKENVEIPSGRVEGETREFTIRTLGEMKTPQEFNRLIIKWVNGAPVYMQDIGTAEIGPKTDRTLVRLNGQPAVGLGIVKQSKANALDVAKLIKEKMLVIEKNLPKGMKIQVGYDSSRFIEQSIEEVQNSLYLAVFLVILVIFFFLGNVRSTLIPAVAIPISLISTFFLMDVLNYSINTLTLLAMTLAIGLVVDDSIVVLENIYRRIEEGDSPMEASFKGMQEIAFAILATTLVLVAIFLPLAFMQGTVGRLFSEFAVALAGSVLISMFVSLSLSPMMCSRFLKTPEEDAAASKARDRFPLYGKVLQLADAMKAWVDQIRDRYIDSLGWAMENSKTVLGATALVLLLSGASYFFLPSEFLPMEDQGSIRTFIMSPEGSTLAYTDRAVRKAEAVYESLPEVRRFFSVIALSFDVPGQVNQGFMFVSLHDKRNRSQQAIVEEILPRMMKIPEANVFPMNPTSGPQRGLGNQVEFVIQGLDLQELSEYSDRILARARQIPGFINVDTSLKLNKPQLRVEVNREKASELGVPVRDIANTMQILMGGMNLSTFQLNSKRYDVMVQMPPQTRLLPEDLNRIFVRGDAHDNLIPLTNVIQFSETVAPKQLSHYGRLRSASITGGVIQMPGVSTGSIMNELEKIAQEELPPHMSYTWAGDSRELRSAQTTTIFAFALAMLIVYLMLAALFESFADPLIVMLTVPLAVCGAFITLFFFGGGINVYSQIGIILLIGLVTKNGILLVDYANIAKNRNAALTVTQAMIEGARVRFRPIVMTAVAMVFGAIPLALGLGAGGASRKAMGLAVVGGLILATLLTLYVIPIAYRMIKGRHEKQA